MNRTELIAKLQALSEKSETMLAAKAEDLEKEQLAKSELYHWCREQMMLIHQIKYQFSQEVARIHQEAARLNQEARSEIEKLRRGNMSAPVGIGEPGFAQPEPAETF